MRHSGIFRITLPRKETPPPAPPVSAAEQLRDFIAFFEAELRRRRNENSVDGRSPVELKVLSSLARRRRTLASELARELAIDEGQLSRLVKTLEMDGLAERSRGKDARQSPLTITAAGRGLVRRLARHRASALSTLLKPMTKAAESELVTALARVRASLARPQAEDEAAPDSTLDDMRLRLLRNGDLAHIAHRLAVLHKKGAKFDATSDQLYLTRAANFLKDYDRARDCGWIAEHHDSLAGACLLKGLTKSTAELQLIHIEPELKGIGLAAMLIDQCLIFAKVIKYTRITARISPRQFEIEDALEHHEFRLSRKESELGEEELGRLWEKRL